MSEKCKRCSFEYIYDNSDLDGLVERVCRKCGRRQVKEKGRSGWVAEAELVRTAPVAQEVQVAEEPAWPVQVTVANPNEITQSSMYAPGEHIQHCVHCKSTNSKVTQTKLMTHPIRRLRYRKCKDCGGMTSTVESL